MIEASKFITIIRPEFMTFCQDACRAATLNHLLFRIAGKCKDQPKEKIQAGEILWYLKNEDITAEMSHAWGVCKVRKEINVLIKMGLLGCRSNPTWGVDRTKHFFFGTEQCAVFLKFYDDMHMCFVHADLSDEVKHLIYSSNANDKSIKCKCVIHQLQVIDVSDANDTSIEAITKIDYKEDTKNTNKDTKEIVAHAPTAPASSIASSQFENDETVKREALHKTITQANRVTQPPAPTKSPSNNVTPQPPTEEEKALQARCKVWYDKITEWCGGPMTKGFQVINEHKSVKSLCLAYNDTQIEAIFTRLTTKDWKWSKIDNRYKVRCSVVFDEAANQAQILKEERQGKKGIDAPTTRPTALVSVEQEKKNKERMHARAEAARQELARKAVGV
jgi:hypothetical protein